MPGKCPERFLAFHLLLNCVPFTLWFHSEVYSEVHSEVRSEVHFEVLLFALWFALWFTLIRLIFRLIFCSEMIRLILGFIFFFIFGFVFLASKIPFMIRFIICFIIRHLQIPICTMPFEASESLWIGAFLNQLRRLSRLGKWPRREQQKETFSSSLLKSEFVVFVCSTFNSHLISGTYQLRQVVQGEHGWPVPLVDFIGLFGGFI